MNVGQFSVGDVQFFRTNDSLTYLPTRTTRLYQVAAGIGLAIAFGYIAILVYRAKPLGQLVDEGNSLNDIAALGAGLLALCLVTAIPFYLKQAKRPYVLMHLQRN
ncbi:MAG TPA: hypothetical protein VJ835_11940 [Fimbriimonadaceae bacterium]|nr:hypothetical protein [Fimbriimonadaceae bacterium]